MRVVNSGMEAHLSGQCTTLATLWKIVREDGAIYGFTDHDTDIEFEGVTHVAATGFTPSAIDTGSDLSVDNLEIQSLLTDASITDDDLRAGKWNYAKIEVCLVNYEDLTQGKLKVRKGVLGEVRTGRATSFAEQRGLTQNLQQVIGRVYTPACVADLGNSKCKVNLASYTVTGTITGVTDRRIFTDSSRTEAAEYFTAGLLTFTSGLNDGLKMEVKTFESGLFSLQESMPYNVQVGDTYTVYAGCDKLRPTCKDKFNNVINFRGFPDTPGRDKLISGKGS